MQMRALFLKRLFDPIEVRFLHLAGDGWASEIGNAPYILVECTVNTHNHRGLS